MSGHSEKYHNEIQALLMEHINYLRLFVEINDIVFSHAGFSKVWINTYNIDLITLNETWLQNPYLNFLRSNDPSTSSTGENDFQGPLWIRPKSLLHSSYFPFQVIGHTELCLNIPGYIKNKKSKIILCDSESHDIIFKLNTVEVKKHRFSTFAQFLRSVGPL